MQHFGHETDQFHTVEQRRLVTKVKMREERRDEGINQMVILVFASHSVSTAGMTGSSEP